MSYDTYTISGGVLGALNLTGIDVKGDGAPDVDYDNEKGWSLGAWLSIPLAEGVSFDPQVMYSLYTYQSTTSNTLIPFGKVSYINIALLLKVHNPSIGLTFGPQFDLLGAIDDTPAGVLEGDFSSTTLSVNVGLELLPHGPIVPYVRYMHGITDLDNRDGADDDDFGFYNANLQLGLKVKLFGKVIPADTDGDGVINKEDLCPTVAGLAALNGCPDGDADGITDAIDKCPDVAGISRYEGCPIPDTDKDGVNDEVDKCITVSGVAKYNGCPIPDTDGDGINDENDKCITVAGLERYGGCPPTDTDKDGVNDDVDKCPTVAGLAQHEGCPPPDTDNDGVLNDKDLCPNTPGPASNFGCPVVESAKFNARMINFVSGSAVLTANAKRSLREGAALMNSEPFNNLIFHIHGHTDSDGSDAFNLTLSKNRAASVRAELMKNGVAAERMTSEGFGEKEPIATNETAAGKALNRRVEILARHSQQLGQPVEVPKK